MPTGVPESNVMSLFLRSVEAPFLCFKSERKFEKENFVILAYAPILFNLFRDPGGNIILKEFPMHI